MVRRLVAFAGVPACKNSSVPSVSKTGKLRKFCSLRPSERALIREAIVLPPLIAAAFRLRGVPWTQARLRRWALGRRRREGSEPSANDAATWIAAAGVSQMRVLRTTGIGGTCLVRSLALWTMLLRRGVETELRIGIRRHEGKLEGHAWLEFAGQPINEDAEKVGTYSPYTRPFSFDIRPDWK